VTVSRVEGPDDKQLMNTPDLETRNRKVLMKLVPLRDTHIKAIDSVKKNGRVSFSLLPGFTGYEKFACKVERRSVCHWSVRVAIRRAGIPC
jgi:hypothetical protein